MSMDIFWLVPVAYATHILEETPRFVSWTKRYPRLFTSRFDMRGFIIGNAAFMGYVVISVFLATANPSPWTLILGLSTASWIFSNFLYHAVLTLVSGIYSPGVVTGGAVYVPTFLYIYGSFWQADMLTLSTVFWSVAVGLAVMYLPFLNAVRAARKDRRHGTKGEHRRDREA